MYARLIKFIKNHTITSVTLFLCLGGVAFSNLTNHTETLLDTLLGNLDSDGDGAISDETFTVTGITIGSAAILEAELEILDGATLSTAEINILDGVTDVTYDEIDHLDGVTNPIQGQLDTKCDEATFGDAIEADDLVKTGTTLTLQAEIPHTDVAETLTASWTQIDLHMSKLTSAPTGVAGRVYYADGDNWDPAGLNGSVAYYVLYDGSDWIALWDEDGTWFISSIETPSYANFANADALYSDDAGGTPYALLDKECKNSILTNAGTGEDSVYTLPAISFGMNFMVTIIDAFQMDIEPPSGDKLWLNGNEMAVDEHIVNAADTKGDTMSCWSIEVSDGVYELFCSSANANWAEASP